MWSDATANVTANPAATPKSTSAVAAEYCSCNYTPGNLITAATTLAKEKKILQLRQFQGNLPMIFVKKSRLISLAQPFEFQFGKYGFDVNKSYQINTLFGFYVKDIYLSRKKC